MTRGSELGTEWETVIGLEIHAQLATQSKIFSGAATAYGAAANTQACAIDLGFPGILPVLNQRAVEMAVLFGLAIDAEIPEESVFARKNYFYPDLPKGYQISQYEQPIVARGHVIIEVNGQPKRINITRAHLEEDAGKSIHNLFDQQSGIDLNRAGTALLEIVSEPELRGAEEAVIYLKTIHALVRYLSICDGNMQEGSFRCDANVSVRRHGDKEFGTRTEIKNVNSFRFVEKAIRYEAARQIQVLESGGKIIQQTRLYDADRDETRPMRSKEDANDYRYFPDPDLLPVVITREWLAQLRQQLPELPKQKLLRFVKDFGLSDYDAAGLTQDKGMADYFEAVLQQASLSPKLVANWLLGDVTKHLHIEELDIQSCPVSPIRLAQLLQRIEDNTVSGKMAKSIFETMWKNQQQVDDIIAAQGLQQISDSSALEKIIDELMANNPEQVAQYRAGKEKVFGFFVGLMMKATQGKANPQQVNDLLKRKLGSQN